VPFRLPSTIRLYNELLLTEDQRDRFDVVLVSPRNPLNIGAVARAMANFGFAHLKVVAPHAPLWHEAKSAVGASAVLAAAVEMATLPEALAECSLVLGTGSLAYRKPEQPVIQLPDLAPMVRTALEQGGRVGLVLGQEKHGLTREDLSYCHALVEIPTCPNQPSMNLGQAAAVCLYELTSRQVTASAPAHGQPASEQPASSAKLELLAGLIERTMVAADYSPAFMREANRHDLRLLLRRFAPTEKDVRRILGLFRRILWRIEA
jgi:tRNA/rRNA methyltransferase